MLILHSPVPIEAPRARRYFQPKRLVGPTGTDDVRRRSIVAIQAWTGSR